MQPVAQPQIDAVDQFAVRLEKFARIPVNGRIAGVIVLDGFEIEAAVLPNAAFLRAAEVFAFENYR